MIIQSLFKLLGVEGEIFTYFICQRSLYLLGRPLINEIFFFKVCLDPESNLISLQIYEHYVVMCSHHVCHTEV
jgi:hypothetical protein